MQPTGSALQGGRSHRGSTETNTPVEYIAATKHIYLTGRLYAVEFMACFVIMAQMLIVFSVGSEISLLMAHLGGPGIAK
jgi:hypothetical protein